MIEGWADNVDQEVFIKALEFGTEEGFRVAELIKNGQFMEKKPAMSVEERESLDLITTNFEGIFSLFFSFLNKNFEIFCFRKS
jgi:hypothetical protein